MLDNIGMPVQRHQPVAQRGRADLAGRRADPHRARRRTTRRPPTTCASCARRSPSSIPDTTFFFLAPDISTQVLNFGLAAPIDVQVVGADRQRGRRPTRSPQQIAARVRAIPGAVDVHLAQVPSSPSSRSTSTARWPRSSALTERDVASDLLVSLSSSAQVAPSFWLDQARRAVPRRRADAAVRRSTRSTRSSTTPISTRRRQAPQLLVERRDDLAHRRARRTSRTSTSRAPTTSRPTSTAPISARSPTRCDASSTSSSRRCRAARRSRIKGQVESMKSSFRGLGYGLVFAVVLVYLLMVVNFQSWLDPFIILMALPGRARGHRLDAVPLAHDAQRAGADGRDHVRRRGHREQHPRRHLRQRSARRRARRAATPRSPPG